MLSYIKEPTGKESLIYDLPAATPTTDDAITVQDNAAYTADIKSNVPTDTSNIEMLSYKEHFIKEPTGKESLIYDLPVATPTTDDAITVQDNAAYTADIKSNVPTDTSNIEMLSYKEHFIKEPTGKESLIYDLPVATPTTDDAITVQDNAAYTADIKSNVPTDTPNIEMLSYKEHFIKEPTGKESLIYDLPVATPTTDDAITVQDNAAYTADIKSNVPTDTPNIEMLSYKEHFIKEPTGKESLIYDLPVATPTTDDAITVQDNAAYTADIKSNVPTDTPNIEMLSYKEHFIKEPTGKESLIYDLPVATPTTDDAITVQDNAAYTADIKSNVPTDTPNIEMLSYKEHFIKEPTGKESLIYDLPVATPTTDDAITVQDNAAYTADIKSNVPTDTPNIEMLSYKEHFIKEPTGKESLIYDLPVATPTTDDAITVQDNAAYTVFKK